MSVTSPETDRKFLSLVPIIMAAGGKFEPQLGPIKSISVLYGKILLIFYRLGEFIVVLSFNPNVDTKFLGGLAEILTRIKKDH